MAELPTYPNPEPFEQGRNQWDRLRAFGSKILSQFFASSGYSSLAGSIINPFYGEDPTADSVSPAVELDRAETGFMSDENSRRAYEYAIYFCEGTLRRGGERRELFPDKTAANVLGVSRGLLNSITERAWAEAEAKLRSEG